MIRPNIGVRFRVNQLGADAHTVARPLHTPFEYVHDPKFVRDLANIPSCQESSLPLPVLSQGAAVGRPLPPTAGAPTDLLPDMLRSHLPKRWKLTPARCPILCAAPSSKELRAHKSGDRYCPNKTAACS